MDVSPVGLELSPLIPPMQLNVFLAFFALWVVAWIALKLLGLILAEQAETSHARFLRQVARRIYALAQEEIRGRLDLGGSSALPGTTHRVRQERARPEETRYRCQSGPLGSLSGGECQSEGQGQSGLCPLSPEEWLREVRERVKRDAKML